MINLLEFEKGKQKLGGRFYTRLEMCFLSVSAFHCSAMAILDLLLLRGMVVVPLKYGLGRFKIVSCT